MAEAVAAAEEEVVMRRSINTRRCIGE